MFQSRRSVHSIVVDSDGGKRKLGFTIVGGSDSPKGAMGIFIKNISSCGLAHESGQLFRGDEILSINGINLQNVTHAEALSTIRKCKSNFPLTLLVARRRIVYRRQMSLPFSTLDSISTIPEEPASYEQPVGENNEKSKISEKEKLVSEGYLEVKNVENPIEADVCEEEHPSEAFGRAELHHVTNDCTKNTKSEESLDRVLDLAQSENTWQTLGTLTTGRDEPSEDDSSCTSRETNNTKLRGALIDSEESISRFPREEDEWTSGVKEEQEGSGGRNSSEDETTDEGISLSPRRNSLDKNDSKSRVPESLNISNSDVFEDCLDECDEVSGFIISSDRADDEDVFSHRVGKSLMGSHTRIVDGEDLMQPAYESHRSHSRFLSSETFPTDSQSLSSTDKLNAINASECAQLNDKDLKKVFKWNQSSVCPGIQNFNNSPKSGLDKHKRNIFIEVVNQSEMGYIDIPIEFVPIRDCCHFADRAAPQNLKEEPQTRSYSNNFTDQLNCKNTATHVTISPSSSAFSNSKCFGLLKTSVKPVFLESRLTVRAELLSKYERRRDMHSIHSRLSKRSASLNRTTSGALFEGGHGF